MLQYKNRKKSCFQGHGFGSTVLHAKTCAEGMFIIKFVLKQFPFLGVIRYKYIIFSQSL